jgi:hypothetical protein
MISKSRQKCIFFPESEPIPDPELVPDPGPLFPSSDLRIQVLPELISDPEPVMVPKTVLAPEPVSNPEPDPGP